LGLQGQILVTWTRVNTILLKTAQEWNHGNSLFAIFWNQNWNCEKVFLKIGLGYLGRNFDFFQKIISRMKCIIKF
jgi:hypothetical protein